MATNAPKGGSLNGALKGRSQFQNTTTGFSVKKNNTTGQFMDVKTSSHKPFKEVRKEK